MATRTAASTSRPAADPGGLRLRSASRGRQRWEVEALAGRPDLAWELEEALRGKPGVLEARANPVTGRVLVLYASAAPSTLPFALLRELVPELAARSATVPTPGRTRARANARGKARGNRAALTRALRSSLPEPRTLVKPPLLSIAGQSLTMLQGMAFVSTVNTARGDAPAFLKALGIVRTGSRLLVMGTISLVLILLGTWVQWYRKKTWQELAETSVQRLRMELVASIERQDLEFFNRYGTARLAHLVTDDTARIGEFIQKAGDKGIEKIVILVVGGIVLALASPLIALVLCVPVPLFFVSSRLFGRRAADLHKLQGRESGRFVERLESSLAGIADVKSFTAEGEERRRLFDAGEQLTEAATRAATVSYLQARINEGVGSIAFSTAAAYSGLLASDGRISQARFNLLIFIFPRLLSVPRESEEIVQLYHRASRSAQEIARVLDAEPRIESGPVRLPAREVRGEVAFEGVSFGYNPSHRVLQEVSFALRPGETLAIVGPTGSGKSTLLRLLLRFYDVDAGRILLDGHDVRELDLGDLRKSVALVSQDVYLFAGTVRDNVRYGRPEATDEEVLQAMLEAGALPLVDLLPGGLDAEVGERGSRLSGGERQRVAIARALLKDAPILALDEATSHLDYETEAAVRRSLRQAAAGRSMILVAHRLATVRQADEILVLERGRIRERGRHEDLVAAGGLYASLWELQSGESSSGGRLEVLVTWPEEG